MQTVILMRLPLDGGKVNRYQIQKIFGHYSVPISDFQEARVRDTVIEADIRWMLKEKWSVITQ